MGEIIRFEGVGKSYGGREALRDFSLSVEEGELLTVVGSSGCGKTTMLKMVNGLNLPDGGRVLVDGTDIARADRIALRRNIGYAIQNSGLFPHLTVWKNIAYVPQLIAGTDKRQLEARVARLMAAVGLEPGLARRYPAELSGGQQQRVGRGLWPPRPASCSWTSPLARWTPSPAACSRSSCCDCMPLWA